jgi:putative tryptophan/tyrosine transport system substrate-binding protein
VKPHGPERIAHGADKNGKNMLKHIVFALCAVLFALCVSAQARESKKLPRIGFLGATSLLGESERIEAFRQGLRELGYGENKNIVIEYRWAEGKFDRLPALAAELARLNVDVIVAGGATSTRAAKEITTEIPIVMGQIHDPVGTGFVASLARPGGNITGLSSLAPEISGKRVELLKEVIPRLSQVAVLGTSTNNPGNAQSLRETEVAAAAFRIQVQYLDVASRKNIETAFRGATKPRADALLLLGSPVFQAHRPQIVELALKHRLPAMYPNPEFVSDGGLMNYGVSIAELHRRAAYYVDRILKGAKPADLPVEQPTKFEFVVNLKTAKQIGLTIPPHVLAPRADKVIR